MAAIAAIALAVALLADQATKALALRAGIARGTSRTFVPLGRRGLPLLWLAAAGVVALAIAAQRTPLAAAGLGAALGGAAGNVLDRLRRGSVVDFVSIGWWPTFNLADAAIVGGGGLALLAALL
jgi:signal peptidase II